MSKVPCEECISYAMCVNQSMIICPIIYNYFQQMTSRLGSKITQRHVDILESIVKVLKKTDWRLKNKGLIIYEVIDANSVGPAISAPNTPTRLSDGSIIFYRKGGVTEYEIEVLNAEEMIINGKYYNSV